MSTETLGGESGAGELSLEGGKSASNLVGAFTNTSLTRIAFIPGGSCTCCVFRAGTGHEGICASTCASPDAKTNGRDRVDNVYSRFTSCKTHRNNDNDKRRFVTENEIVSFSRHLRLIAGTFKLAWIINSESVTQSFLTNLLSLSGEEQADLVYQDWLGFQKDYIHGIVNSDEGLEGLVSVSIARNTSTSSAQELELDQLRARGVEWRKDAEALAKVAKSGGYTSPDDLHSPEQLLARLLLDISAHYPPLSIMFGTFGIKWDGFEDKVKTMDGVGELAKELGVILEDVRGVGGRRSAVPSLNCSNDSDGRGSNVDDDENNDSPSMSSVMTVAKGLDGVSVADDDNDSGIDEVRVATDAEDDDSEDEAKVEAEKKAELAQAERDIRKAEKASRSARRKHEREMLELQTVIDDQRRQDAQLEIRKRQDEREASRLDKINSASTRDKRRSKRQEKLKKDSVKVQKAHEHQERLKLLRIRAQELEAEASDTGGARERERQDLVKRSAHARHPPCRQEQLEQARVHTYESQRKSDRRSKRSPTTVADEKIKDLENDIRIQKLELERDRLREQSRNRPERGSGTRERNSTGLEPHYRSHEDSDRDQYGDSSDVDSESNSSGAEGDEPARDMTTEDLVELVQRRERHRAMESVPAPNVEEEHILPQDMSTSELLELLEQRKRHHEPRQGRRSSGTIINKDTQTHGRRPSATIHSGDTQMRTSKTSSTKRRGKSSTLSTLSRSELLQRLHHRDGSTRSAKSVRRQEAASVWDTTDTRGQRPTTSSPHNGHPIDDYGVDTQWDQLDKAGRIRVGDSFYGKCIGFDPFGETHLYIQPTSEEQQSRTWRNDGRENGFETRLDKRLTTMVPLKWTQDKWNQYYKKWVHVTTEMLERTQPSTSGSSSIFAKLYNKRPRSLRDQRLDEMIQYVQAMDTYIKEARSISPIRGDLALAQMGTIFERYSAARQSDSRGRGEDKLSHNAILMHGHQILFEKNYEKYISYKDHHKAGLVDAARGVTMDEVKKMFQTKSAASVQENRILTNSQRTQRNYADRSEEFGHPKLHSVTGQPVMDKDGLQWRGHVCKHCMDRMKPSFFHSRESCWVLYPYLNPQHANYGRPNAHGMGAAMEACDESAADALAAKSGS